MIVSGKQKISIGNGTYAEDNDEQKVHVRDVVELKVQVLRYEAYSGVLGCPYLVPRIVGFRVALLVALVGGERYVKVDSPSGILLFAICF